MSNMYNVMVHLLCLLDIYYIVIQFVYHLGYNNV